MNISIETCPPLEDIAAFLDGKLSGEERAHIVAHLAECPSCYAVFADAARFQLDEEQESSAPEKATEVSGTVVSFPRRKIPTWAASAAALLLVGLAAIPIYRQYNEMPVLIASELIDPGMPVDAESIGKWTERLRSGDSEAPLTDSPAEFLLGANLVDLRLRLARNEGGEADEILKRIGKQMDNLLVKPEEETKFYAEARGRIADGAPPQSLLTEADRVEATLTEFLSDSTYFAFGKWTEAGRLHAEARRADFFKNRENRRFLRWLLRNSEEVALAPEVAVDLRQLQRILETDLQEEREFVKASALLQRILDHYQVEARIGSEI